MSEHVLHVLHTSGLQLAHAYAHCRSLALGKNPFNSISPRHIVILYGWGGNGFRNQGRIAQFNLS